MKILGVEHIGIAVDGLDECIEKFENALNLKCEGRETIEASGVEVAFFGCGSSKIELVTPAGAASPIGSFLSKRGNAIHHICLRVEGIDDWLAYLKQIGVELIDTVPRQGASGKRVAFISPRSMCNILIELSEDTP
ncbi:MAG: methylmalonyl-CoA epimerase [Candidatus Eisenbacteria bacterium]